MFNITSTFNLVTVGWEGTMFTEDSFMKEARTYTTFKIATFIAKYWFAILVPIGLVGNTLSFLVMIKPNNRKVSTCIYMAAISINDNIMMYMSFHDYFVSTLQTLQIVESNPVECACIAFGFLFALQNGAFQVVAMTIDKYIAIKLPHRAATYSTVRRARMIAVGLYVFAFIYNIPHLFFSRLVHGQCIAYAVDSPLTRAYSWFSFIFNAIVPFIMLVHMNYVIVKTVRNSRKLFRVNDARTGTIKVQGMETRQKSMRSAENQLTIMMILVAILFLILLCPTYIRFIYLIFTTRDTPLKYANSYLLFQISFKLYATNSGLNFFLYCISGKKFRNDLKEILCHCCVPWRSARKGFQSNATEMSTGSSMTLSSPWLR